MNRQNSTQQTAPKNYLKKPLAFITGASSGIGRALACHFAKKGYNLVIVARSQMRLEQLKNFLCSSYPCDIFVLPLDLSSPEAVQAISDYLILKNLTVDVLVNNAGFGVHGPFENSCLSQEMNLISLQISTTVALTKLILTQMIPKKRGYILNVASVYSFLPVPYQSVYSACKAFLLSFSSSLAYENQSFGIRVTALCPGITKTEFRFRSQGAKDICCQKRTFYKKWTEMSAERVAGEAYQALMKGKRVVVLGLVNRIFVCGLIFLPRDFLLLSMTFINHLRGVNAKKT